MPDNDADKRSEHTVVIAGVEHTLLLTDEDAKRYDSPDRPADDPSANDASANDDASAKAKQPANKSRAASDTK